jgi:hypothetical protein
MRSSASWSDSERGWALGRAFLRGLRESNDQIFRS